MTLFISHARLRYTFLQDTVQPHQYYSGGGGGGGAWSPNRRRGERARNGRLQAMRRWPVNACRCIDLECKSWLMMRSALVGEYEVDVDLVQKRYVCVCGCVCGCPLCAALPMRDRNHKVMFECALYGYILFNTPTLCCAFIFYSCTSCRLRSWFIFLPHLSLPSLLTCLLFSSSMTHHWIKK